MIQKKKNKAQNHNLLSDHTGGCSYLHVISLGPRPKTNPSTCGPRQYTGSMQYMRRMRSGDKTNVICLALFPGHVGNKARDLCCRAAIYLYKINCLRVCTMAHAMWTVSKWARACIYASRWYHGNINNSY